MSILFIDLKFSLTRNNTNQCISILNKLRKSKSSSFEFIELLTTFLRKNPKILNEDNVKIISNYLNEDENRFLLINATSQLNNDAFKTLFYSNNFSTINKLINNLNPFLSNAVNLTLILQTLSKNIKPEHLSIYTNEALIKSFNINRLTSFEALLPYASIKSINSLIKNIPDQQLYSKYLNLLNRQKLILEEEKIIKLATNTQIESKTNKKSL